ncbi:MAG: type II secretion system F family protein [Pirellulaceae bacterium]|nr:type II secretion system F family protein [Pirellulaceae bacterium]
MSTLIALFVFLAIAFALLGLLLLIAGLIGRGIKEPEFVFTNEEKEVLGQDYNGRFHRLIAESNLPLTSGSAIMIVLLSAMTFGALPIVLTDNFLAGACGVLVGAMLPIVFFSVARWWYLRRYKGHLAEALQIVADGLRSGVTLEDSCRLVASEMTTATGTAFEDIARQLNLGKLPVDVFRQTARKIPLPEFQGFAAAVLVHQKSGGDLARLTERLAQSARDRQETKSHLQAVTAGSKLSAFGMVIGGILAVAILSFIEYFDPRVEYISYFLTHEFGTLAIIIAVGLQLLGFLWIWRVLKTDY